MIAQEQKEIERPFIDLESACKYLSIAKATMYQKTMRHTIKFYRVGLRKILFKVTDLDEYIENHRVKTIDEIQSEALNRIISKQK